MRDPRMWVWGVEVRVRGNRWFRAVALVIWLAFGVGALFAANSEADRYDKEDVFLILFYGIFWIISHFSVFGYHVELRFQELM